MMLYARRCRRARKFILKRGKLNLLRHRKIRPCIEGCGVLFCVPSMALILLVKVQSRVFTAKCSKPQVGISNGMDGGSGVAKFLNLRTET